MAPHVAALLLAVAAEAVYQTHPTNTAPTTARGRLQHFAADGSIARRLRHAAASRAAVALQQHSVSLNRRSLTGSTGRSLRRQQANMTWFGGDGGKPAGWFGGFSEMESTYDPDSWPGHPEDNKARLVEYGKDPRGWPKQFSGIPSDPAAWYAETPSGGPADAWQTFYPPSPDGLGSADERHNPWIATPEGWKQAYINSDLTSGGNSPRKQAKWFDSEVLQYDGYGRRNMPDAVSPRRYTAVDGWQERAVNTTIGCAAPGCNASTMLQAYDATTEEAANCRLSIMVHPTDFDDDWSNENFEWWKVNGKVVNTRCDPRARGCNASAAAPLYSCMSNFELTDLVQMSQGTMQIQGKISPAVDECPYEGQLLNGVVVVACMVRRIPPTLAPVGFSYYGTDYSSSSDSDSGSGGDSDYNATAVVEDLFNCTADPTCHGSGHDGYIGGYNGTDGYPPRANGTGTGINSSDYGPGGPYGPGGEHDLSGPTGPYGPGGAGEGSPAMPYDPSAPYDPETNPHGPGGYGPYGPAAPGSPDYPYGPHGPTGPPHGPWGPDGPAYGPGPYGDGPYGWLNPDEWTGPGIGGPDYGPGACIPPCPAEGPGAGAFPGTRAAAGAAVVAGTGNIPIQCDTSGCNAQTLMYLDDNVTLVAQNGGKCTLSVAINQTDYDEDLGSVEMVASVQVESYNIGSNIKPGKNPCTAAWSGTPLLLYEKFNVIVTDHDITNLASALVSLSLQATITERVDECASQGKLFDGLARVDCTVPATGEASGSGNSTGGTSGNGTSTGKTFMQKAPGHEVLTSAAPSASAGVPAVATQQPGEPSAKSTEADSVVTAESFRRTLSRTPPRMVFPAHSAPEGAAAAARTPAFVAAAHAPAAARQAQQALAEPLAATTVPSFLARAARRGS